MKNRNYEINPLIKDFEKVVTPFAFQILCQQVDLASCYSCTQICNQSDIAEEERCYHGSSSMSYIAHLSFVPEVSVDATEDTHNMHNMGFHAEVDYSGHFLLLPSVKYVTSTKSCSCQFPFCWGLPCRHKFRKAFGRETVTNSY